ncbi:MAG: anaerobic ribonucleoside-triphosphate reductase [Nanoarchaeota archaeon]|nr:anaerobic ribonucleoside-triphosphate reductase [Nanoarchaeota archaeon]
MEIKQSTNLLVIEKEDDLQKQEFEVLASPPQIAEQKVQQKAVKEREQKTIQRTKCEVFSRVVGYLRPIEHWNEGKRAEWEERKVFENCA